jgi:hypothetical protein
MPGPACSCQLCSAFPSLSGGETRASPEGTWSGGGGTGDGAGGRDQKYRGYLRLDRFRMSMVLTVCVERGQWPGVRGATKEAC